MTSTLQNTILRWPRPSGGYFGSLAVGLLLWLTIAAQAVAASASSQCVPDTPERRFQGQTVGIMFESQALERPIRQAVSVWSGCDNGDRIPNFLIGVPGDRNLYVRLEMRSIGRRCGVFWGNEIVLYRHAVKANGTVHRCGSAALNLAHELGHVLGLADAPRSPECRQHIMAKLSPGNLFHRSAQPAECRAARGFRKLSPLRPASP